MKIEKIVEAQRLIDQIKDAATVLGIEEIVFDKSEEDNLDYEIDEANMSYKATAAFCRTIADINLRDNCIEDIIKQYLRDKIKELNEL